VVFSTLSFPRAPPRVSGLDAHLFDTSLTSDFHFVDIASLLLDAAAAVSTETRAAMTDKEKRRQKRHTKIRAKLSGTAERPRISVYRSNQHTYVQVIDDENQKTLCAIGTMSSSIKEQVGKEEWKTKTVDAARAVGAALGATMMEKGIKTAVFDRGGFVYHGRVKAVAEACREAGVEF
jgi:large subunit ribosomal protein L18